MKLILAALLSLSATVALANPNEWLICNTSAGALDSVNIALQAGDGEGGPVRVLGLVNYQSGNSDQLTAEVNGGELAAMQRKGQYEFVFKTEKSGEYGGGLSDAALLVLKGKKNISGKLAFKSTVYTLTCKPTE